MPDDDLEARVDQLETIVEQQGERIKELQSGGVGRRGVLAGGGALAGGGLAALLSGSASAQSAPTASSDSEQSGKMGASGDSNDVYVDQLYDTNGTEAANIDPGEPWNFSMRDVVFGGSYHDSVSTNSLDSGRSWQDLTASRSIGSTFTNDSDSEIWVNVVLESDSPDGTVVGVRFDNPTLDLSRFRQEINNGDGISLLTIVPSGSKYSVQSFTGSVTVRSWLEFRS